MVRSKFQKRFDAGLTHAILIATCVLMIFPVFYALMTSFKTKGDVLTSPPTILPPVWSLDGYLQVFRSDMFKYYLPNTAINALGASLLIVPLAALAGYAFSRHKFRGNTLLLLFVLTLMMIPGLTNLVALYRLGSQLGILSTHLIMIVVYTAGGLPFTIWIMKTFFDAIPRELEEAALIDGCSAMQSLWYVITPLALPGLFAAFLLMLVDTWNEFLAAVVLLSANDSRTAMVGLYDFQSAFETAYHVQTAACILIALPVVIVFIFGRRTFFNAMLEGALKG
jgi:ABC-type glycerol-3-phosphate transport system permease component